MSKLWITGAILLAFYAWGEVSTPGAPFENAPTDSVSSVYFVNTASDEGNKVLSDAFRRRASNIQVEGSGVVTRVLTDDNNGSRHQRFILTLQSGQTLLVAHNIDLAPRVGALKQGDRVDFFGEYEWNSQGGVIHWTHKDPQRRHVAGWLRHDGRTYQ